MTSVYNVHIYREMRVVFGGIEAHTPEAAAAIARDKPTDEADSIDDCEGETLSALVDVRGDEEYEHSQFIDFEDERLRKTAPRMLTALRAFIKADAMAEECAEWKWENLSHTFELARDVVAEAESACPPTPASSANVPPQPGRFEIEYDPADTSDRVYVMVDGKFDVAIIRTDEGVVVDVYPKNGFDTIATTYAFDSEVEQESSTN